MDVAGDPTRTRYAYLLCRAAHRKRKEARQDGDCHNDTWFYYRVAEDAVFAVLEVTGRHNDWWRKPSTRERAELNKVRRQIVTKIDACDRYMAEFEDDPSAAVHIRRLKAEIKDLKQRETILDAPQRLAELYEPGEIDKLLQMRLGSVGKPELRREINQKLRLMIDKVILTKAEEIFVRLMSTHGRALEFIFDIDGEYLQHHVRDVATGQHLNQIKPKIPMLELNRILNRWGQRVIA